MASTDGSTMFVCHAEDDLNFDEFETENDVESNDAIEHVDIQNIASNIIGEHDCTFEQLPNGINLENVKLIVTTEANAYNQIDADTEFKAELQILNSSAKIVRVSEKLYIHCPKSGKNVYL